MTTLVHREEIEKLVLGRETHRAMAAISSFVRQKKRSEEAVLLAADWLRRLARHREALKVLGLERVAGRRNLVAKSAQILGLLGASEFALQVLGEISVRSASELWIAGHIHMDLYEPARALVAYKKAAELDRRGTEPHAYRARLARVALADAYCRTGDYASAHSVLESVLALTREPLLGAICLQARGEYCAREGRFKAALGWLKKAEKLFPEAENTVDIALLHKWMGFALGRAGKMARALPHLQQARRIFSSPEYRPEALLDVRRLEMELGLLSVEEQKRVFWFPGTPDGFRALLHSSVSPAASRDPASFGTRSARYEVDLSAMEWRSDDHRHCGLPLEIQMLGYLGIAGPRGLGVARLKALLWPGQAHSFLQQDNRLHALIHRLRRVHGFGLEHRDGTIRLTREMCAQVRTVQGQSRPPRFVSEASEFSSRDLSTYYEMSLAHSKTRIRQWVRTGWIERIRSNSRIKYKKTMS